MAAPYGEMTQTDPQTRQDWQSSTYVLVVGAPVDPRVTTLSFEKQIILIVVVKITMIMQKAQNMVLLSCLAT
jgi:hypothetical protein